MNDDKSVTGAAFETAADKRAHDTERLSEEQQDRIDETRRRAQQDKAAARQQQAQRRDREIAKERAKILREHPKMVLEPKQEGSAPSREPNKEEVERMAEHAVDRSHCLELTAIDVAANGSIDSIVNEEAQSRASTEEPSVDHSADRDNDPELGTFYSPESGRDGGRER